MALVKRFCECYNLKVGVYLLAIIDILASGGMMCDYMLKLPGKINAFRRLNMYSSKKLDVFRLNLDIAIWVLVADMVMVLFLLIPPTCVDASSSIKIRKQIRVALIPSIFERVLSVMHGIAAVVWLPLAFSIKCAEIYGLMIALGFRILLGIYLVVIAISYYQELGEKRPINKEPARQNYLLPKHTQKMPVKENKPERIHYYAKPTKDKDDTDDVGMLERRSHKSEISEEDSRPERRKYNYGRPDDVRQSNGDAIKPVHAGHPYQGRKGQTRDQIEESRPLYKPQYRDQERIAGHGDAKRYPDDTPDGELELRARSRQQAYSDERKHKQGNRTSDARTSDAYRKPQSQRHRDSEEDVSSDRPRYDHKERYIEPTEHHLQQRYQQRYQQQYQEPPEEESGLYTVV